MGINYLNEYLKKTSKLYQFVVLVEPILNEAITFVWQHVAIRCGQLTPYIKESTILESVIESLVDIVEPIISRTCVLEMHNLRKRGYLKGESSEERFDHYISLLRDPDNRKQLLSKYQGMNEQVNLQVTQFQSALCELFDRLNTDISELGALVNSNPDELTLHHLIFDGDKHCDGRGVCILTFKSRTVSKQLVYKPRSLKIDQAFGYFTTWLHDNGYPYSFYTPKVIDKGEYGWCEFVDNKPCAMPDELKRYYHRFGALLAIIHLLGGYDIHAENIIACSEYPVIIDLECLFRPYIQAADNQTDKDAPRCLVTDTHFLPSRTMLSDGHQGIDISAFSVQGNDYSSKTIMEWDEVGTDKMYLKRVAKQIQSQKNVPTLNGDNVDPLDYTNDFESGFNAMYQVFLENKQQLLDDHFPLSAFKGAKIRLVFRNTSLYSKTLYESYHPELLYDKSKRIKHLRQISIGQYDKDVFPAEIYDLEHANIPYFYSYVDDVFIYSSKGRQLGIAVEKSGYQRILSQIPQYISEQDLVIQLHLIKTSFESKRLNELCPKPSTPGRMFKTNRKADINDLQSRAHSIIKQELDYLAERMIINRERVFWACVEKVSDKHWNPGFTDIYLYNGIAGIGLVFAHAANIFKEQKYFDVAQACSNSLDITLNSKDSSFFQSIGGYAGLGSLIYSLKYFYLLLGDQHALNNIQRCCQYIKALIPQDNNFDIIHGAAGCLAALISASELIEPSLFDELTGLCIDRILSAYSDPFSLPECAKTKIMNRSLLGFSHGVTGIAWALDKYDVLYPDRKPIKSWIQRALDYERKYFSSKHLNWSDLRGFSDKNDPHVYQYAWCHGAPGIGLAKLDMSKHWHDDCFVKEINVAIGSTLLSGFGSYLNLCHGDLGNLELILSANEEVYLSILDNIISGIENHGISTDLVNARYTPGLMTGTAGISLQLLRLLHPDKVPSVLLLK